MSRSAKLGKRVFLPFYATNLQGLEGVTALALVYLNLKA